MQVYPAAWGGAGGAGSALAPLSGRVPEEAAAAAPSANKYHRAMLLHALVLLAVHDAEAMVAVGACVEQWFEEHRQAMWNQFNAEIRFARVVRLLSPFTQTPSPNAAGPTAVVTAAAATIAAVHHPINAAADLPLESGTACMTVYSLGESHTLPLAWQLLVSGGRAFRVVPRLVIGLKAWHFNTRLATSRERGILVRHAQTIPRGSTVIVCAGEIDLREAGVIAMLPDHWGEHRPPKYSSPREALAITLAAFFDGQ